MAGQYADDRLDDTALHERHYADPRHRHGPEFFQCVPCAQRAMDTASRYLVRGWRSTIQFNRWSAEPAYVRHTQQRYRRLERQYGEFKHGISIRDVGELGTCLGIAGLR